MKKILFIVALISLTLGVSAQRWQNAPKDNSGRQLTFADKSVTLASTDSISPNASHTFYTVAELTEAKTVIVKKLEAKKWDMVTLKFLSDTAAAGHIVTFSTGTYPYTNTLWTTTSGNTMTVKTSKSATITFLYDGTVWTEFCRNVQY